MKRMTLAVLAALLVASPAFAAAKKSKRVHAPAPKADTRNEDSWRLVRDSLPVWLPTWSIPIVLSIQEQQKMEGRKAVRGKKRMRKARR